MDYSIDHTLNHAVRAHGLLVSVITGFAHWGVILFGVAACAIWLLSVPGRDDVWKRACASGLGAASLGLLVNQVIGHVWDRPRPYEDHPHGVIPLLAPSHDPSFPSDHATAAFAIAFGIFFVHRRAGTLFLAMATLIGASRVLSGMHYPGDVVAGAVIGLASGFLAARLGMRPILVPLIGLVSRVTDPVVTYARRTSAVRRTVLDPRARAAIVTAAGSVLLVLFAVRVRAHLLDEMELAFLAMWIALVAGAAILAASARRRPMRNR